MSNKQILIKLRQHPYFSVLIDIVRQSGSIILDCYDKQNQKIEYKKDESPLTKADLLSHKFINNELSSVSNLPIISEESEITYTNEPSYWLIDCLLYTSDAADE